MKTIAIIMARMGSTRLPGKSLLDLCGKPVIERVYERAEKIRKVSSVVVATSSNIQDDAIAHWCESNGVNVFRGAEQDCLGRFLGAAEFYNADAALYIGGDCPLFSADLYSDALDLFLQSNVDYLSNLNFQTLPEGCDIGIIRRGALQEISGVAELQFFRTNIFSYLAFCDNHFSIFDFKYPENLSHIHWSCDTKDDYDFLLSVFREIPECQSLTFEETRQAINQSQRLLEMQNSLDVPQMKNALMSSAKLIKELVDEVERIRDDEANGQKLSKELEWQLRQVEALL